MTSFPTPFEVDRYLYEIICKQIISESVLVFGGTKVHQLLDNKIQLFLNQFFFDFVCHKKHLMYLLSLIHISKCPPTNGRAHDEGENEESKLRMGLK